VGTARRGSGALASDRVTERRQPAPPGGATDGGNCLGLVGALKELNLVPTAVLLPDRFPCPPPLPQRLQNVVPAATRDGGGGGNSILSEPFDERQR